MLDDVVDCTEDLAAALREVDQLEDALETRLVIGQAEGIIMERLGIDEETAFRFLVRVSSTTNIKLRDVAAHIVQTRQFPTVA